MNKDEHNKMLYQFALLMKTRKPKWVGVDWAAGHGMNRGEVMERDGNVTYVRFKDADLSVGN